MANVNLSDETIRITYHALLMLSVKRLSQPNCKVDESLETALACFKELRETVK